MLSELREISVDIHVLHEMWSMDCTAMIRGYAWGVAYPYLTRIGYGYALDTPRIHFQPYLKNMDMYWLGYTYPTRMEHLCERETMGGRDERGRGGGAAVREPEASG